jgi:hypothetical protein
MIAIGNSVFVQIAMFSDPHMLGFHQE